MSDSKELVDELAGIACETINDFAFKYLVVKYFSNWLDG